jgi:hypothetical protein
MLRIGRPRDLVHLLAVILIIGGQPFRFVFAGTIGLRYPKISPSQLILYPGKTA